MQTLCQYVLPIFQYLMENTFDFLLDWEVWQWQLV